MTVILKLQKPCQALLSRKKHPICGRSIYRLKIYNQPYVPGINNNLKKISYFLDHCHYPMHTNNMSKTKNMTLTEAAKEIRKDIKAASKSGVLPAGFKVSVRSRQCLAYPSITIKIAANEASAPGKADNDTCDKIVKTLDNIGNKYSLANVDPMDEYSRPAFFLVVCWATK